MSNLLNKNILKNGTELKNNIVMAPMTTWSSNDDYTVSDQEIAYYGFRNDGPGMIITGCTHVQANGIGFDNEFAAYDDKFVPGLTKLAATLKENGAKAILQINHAGNKALPHLIENGEVVSASPVETKATMFVDSLKPKELSEEEIQQVIKDFGETTRRAIKAGFDGIEIHGAHGFLIQNFLSPFFNKREDRWGGSLKKRLKFPIEVFKEIKRVTEKYADKNFIIGYRVSPEEPMENALRLSDVYALIDELINLDVTYIHASLPDALKAHPISNENTTYLKEISQYINGRTTLIAAGNIKRPADADKVMEFNTLPAIGHAFITDPKWVQKFKNGNSDSIETSIIKEKVASLKLPDKLWNFIQNSGNWFDIK
ncbi:NADH-dependent flavin oxidoreductase [Holzapfeliella sp. JNUCC 72]